MQRQSTPKYPVRKTTSALHALLFGTLISTSAFAETSCHEFKTLAKFAQQNFVETGTAENLIDQISLLSTAEKCSNAKQLSGATELICYWRFEYRTQSATTRFEELNAAINTCSPKGEVGTNDQGVNHPDFYDLRTYLLKNTKIAVSLKDKAALGETYVFMRIQQSE